MHHIPKFGADSAQVTESQEMAGAAGREGGLTKKVLIDWLKKRL
jgi:hypothetical protein